MPIHHLRKRSYGYIRRHQHSDPPPSRHIPPRRKGGHPFIFTLLSLAILGFLSFTILIAWASQDLPDPDRLTDRKVAQSTKIYDRTGEHLLYEIFAQEKRTIVELADIPQNLANAVIATEDTEFYRHKGVRPMSILRAFVWGLIPGKRVQGTSTLTQQLVKNAILTNERKLSRKIKEIILSLRLEQKYSKDQILKIYFNEIPYGSTNYGAESAAQSYFGKHVKDITLAESATLAGIPKAPSRYLNDLDALRERRNFVLRRMFEEGFISEEEKNTAQDEPLTINPRYTDIKAPHFVLYVKEQLVQKYGETMVDTGGLNVITTLDWDKQQIAEAAVSSTAQKVLPESNANNAALVALDPKTGQILAMVGSRDFFNTEIDGQFNVATLGKRQPGSSFKPVVYAAAFEKGYTADTILFDVVTNFAASGKSYTPKNYDQKERGPVTVRQALQGSLNIPAVQTLYLVGDQKGVAFAERVGYTTLSQGSFGLSLVLGGGEVKLLEHTNAFATFANEGKFHPPISILRVEDSEGNTFEEWQQEDGEQVMSREVAALISNILSDNPARAFVFGANSYLILPDRPAAAKSGTTNNNVDGWTVGYTPQLAAGVWVGNTDNTPMKPGADGSKVAAPIWQMFMKESLKDVPVENFPAPPSNDANKPILRGSTGGGVTLAIDKVTGKRATSSTPAAYIVERTFIPPHSILHYVNKDDPRGAAQTNPDDDPQYLIWENAIQDWVKRKKEKEPEWNISFEDPPTEFDDVHSLELIPTLQVLQPTPSSTLTSRLITTNINASAPRGVAKVTYKIDAKYVAVIREAPFNLNYEAIDLDPGAHTLIVIVEDDIGNRVEETVPFTLVADTVQPGVSWMQSTLTIKQGEFPRNILLNHHKLDQIESVRIYVEKEDGSERKLLTEIDDFSQLFNNQILFTLNTLPQGIWNLDTETMIVGVEVARGEKMTVIVE